MPSLVPYMPLDFLPDELRQWKRQYFTYPIRYAAGSAQSGGVALAASAQSQPASVNLQGDSFFVCIAFCGNVSAIDESSVDAVPRILLTVQDSGSGQNLSLNPVDWPTTVGTGENPFFLPYPRIFQPNATVTTLATNLIATAKNVDLTLQGFKIFAPPGAWTA